MLIIKGNGVGSKHCNDPKVFFEYSNYMDGIYGNINEYNPNRKYKVLIVSDNMIADMLSNKKPNPMVTEVENLRWKTKHFLCFYHTIVFCGAEKC